MNIHWSIVDGQIQYLTTEQYRRRTGTNGPSKKGTQPPRARTDLGKTMGLKKSGMLARIAASKVYPGGKKLRRATAELFRRQEAHTKTVSQPKNALSYQKPGSMKS